MRLNSADIISRPTQTSARALSVVSLTSITVSILGLQPTNWPLLAQPLDPRSYEIITVGMVIVLVVSLIVNWLGDYVGYFKWFSSNEVSKGSLIGQTGPKGTEPIIEGLKRRIGWLEHEFHRIEGAKQKLERFDPKDGELGSSGQNVAKSYSDLSAGLQNVEAVQTSLNDRLQALEEILAEVERSFKVVDLTAKAIVVGWYLGVPIVLAITSVALSVISLIEAPAAV